MKLGRLNDSVREKTKLFEKQLAKCYFHIINPTCVDPGSSQGFRREGPTKKRLCHDMTNLSSYNLHVITADQLDFERIRWKQEEVGGFLWQVYTHIWYVGETPCLFSFICHNVSTMSILEYHSEYQNLFFALRYELSLDVSRISIEFVLFLRPIIAKTRSELPFVKTWIGTIELLTQTTAEHSDSYRICLLRILVSMKRIFSKFSFFPLFSFP
jgi:hypothetical protein